MPPWNLIQKVSLCAPPGLHLNFWHASIKYHPVCESLCISWALFESLMYFNEILSRMWVSVHLLGSIWIVDILHPASELLSAFWAPFDLLTYYFYILFSLYLSSSICSLVLLFWYTYISQINHVRSLVGVQFNVRPYLTLFQSLCLYIPVYRHLPCLVSLVGLILPLFNIHAYYYMDSHSCLSWTFILDHPARLHSQGWLYQSLEIIFQDPVYTSQSRVG